MKRLAIVTGASKGIGWETSLLLAAAGCDLILCGRDLVCLAKLQERCKGTGVRAETFDQDLTHRSAPQNLAELITSTGEGNYLTLINNAGYAWFGDFIATDSEVIDRHIEINLSAPMRLCRYLLPLMVKRGGGQIINVASIAAIHPFSTAAAYCASKAGLAMLGRCLSEAYRRQGIRVTTLLPGSVDTPLWDSMESTPPRPEMLKPIAVGEAIRDLVLMPLDRNVDEIQLLPPGGIL